MHQRRVASWRSRRPLGLPKPNQNCSMLFVAAALTLMACSTSASDDLIPDGREEGGNDLAAFKRTLAEDQNSYFLRPIFVLDPFEENPDLSQYGIFAPEDVPPEDSGSLEQPPSVGQDIDKSQSDQEEPEDLSMTQREESEEEFSVGSDTFDEEDATFGTETASDDDEVVPSEELSEEGGEEEADTSLNEASTNAANATIEAADKRDVEANTTNLEANTTNVVIEVPAEEELSKGTNTMATTTTTFPPDDEHPIEQETAIEDDELTEFLSRFGAKASAELPNHHYHHTSHCGVWGQRHDTKRADLSVLYLLFQDVVVGDGDSTREDGQEEDESFSSFVRQQLEEYQQERLDSLTQPQTISGASPESTTVPSMVDEVDESLLDNENEPRSESAEYAQESSSKDFVDGLDDIDKLFEEVDVPEELDHGTSIQEILNSSGRRIIIKRIAVGLKTAKQWTINIWRIGKSKVTDKEAWQRLGQQTLDTSKKIWSMTNELVDNLLDRDSMDIDNDYKREFEAHKRTDDNLTPEEEEEIRRWLEQAAAESTR
mmetsp:Transcript_17467/g.47645  ORF Transcript_17467/g.47645 Transcript_17467/m.47645 type:complete len:545 (-) Transcript_17467:4076-5710(-)